jgi:hypothetical protein
VNDDCLFAGWLQELADEFGEVNARALSYEWGGVRLYIPQAPKDDHPITKTVGRQAADWLAYRFGGTSIYVPCEQARAHRNQQILEQHAGGRSVSALARQFGLSHRHVTRILSEARQ